jgi:hypothetical protein
MLLGSSCADVLSRGQDMVGISNHVVRALIEELTRPCPTTGEQRAAPETTSLAWLRHNLAGTRHKDVVAPPAVHQVKAESQSGVGLRPERINPCVFSQPSHMVTEREERGV